MDPKTFLLEREEIYRRLEEKRRSVVATRSAMPSGFLGLSWGDISQLIFSFGAGRGFAAWLPRVLFTTAAPFFASFFRDKVENFIRPKSFLQRFGDLMSLWRSKSRS